VEEVCRVAVPEGGDPRRRPHSALKR
jgi:hypothetical protein